MTEKYVVVIDSKPEMVVRASVVSEAIRTIKEMLKAEGRKFNDVVLVSKDDFMAHFA